MSVNCQKLGKKIRACQICSGELPFKPKPIFQIDQRARILIAGQAPGHKAHESEIPFDDQSGDRLRLWMGITKDIFYNSKIIAIVPMGFCFPGSKRGGDLPPRKECAPAWRSRILDALPNIQLTLIIGSYAIKWHLKSAVKSNLTKTVKSWQSLPSNIIPLPHPSPRNNIWLAKNKWFKCSLLPEIKRRVEKSLNT